MFAIGLKLVGNRFKTSPMTSPMGTYQSYGHRFKTFTRKRASAVDYSLLATP